MHCVLVEMGIIFLVVSVVQLLISSNYICEVVHYAVELSNRILINVDIGKDFSVKILSRTFCRIQHHAAVFKRSVSAFKGLDRALHRLQNVFFFSFL